MYIHHAKLNEKEVAPPNLVSEMMSLVDSHVRNLLCAVSQYAAHAGVELAAGMMDSVMDITYSPASPQWRDPSAFILLNTFQTDFLAFSFEFFDEYS